LANEYERDFVGRYNSTESELTVMDIAPSLAYKVNDWFSIGGGLNVQRASAKLENAIPAPGATQSTTTDGMTDLSGDDVTVGFNAGILLKPVQGTKIGVHYKQGISHTLEGRVINRLPISGALGALSGTSSRIAGNAELDLPAIASFSLSQKVGNNLTLLGSANWNEWSNFDDIPVKTTTLSITEQGYKNTWSFAIGARYDVNEKLQLKAGFQYDPTPTVDEHRSTRIPDGDRKWYAAGLTYNLNEQLSFDLSGTYVDVSKEKINITDISPVASTRSRTVGETEGSVGIISTAIRYKF
jgi:long-chain fatty acid transport protein